LPTSSTGWQLAAQNDQACNKLPTFNSFVGYLFKFLCLCDVIFDVSKNREMEFSNENVINAVQKEGILWDATISASIFSISSVVVAEGS